MNNVKKHCTIGGRGLPLPIIFGNWELSTAGQLFLPFHGSDSFGTVNTVITEIVGKLSLEKKSRILMITIHMMRIHKHFKTFPKRKTSQK